MSLFSLIKQILRNNPDGKDGSVRNSALGSSRDSSRSYLSNDVDIRAKMHIRFITEPNEVDVYNNKLPLALNSAGYYIQTFLESMASPKKREWGFIQSKPLLLPNFQHLCFFIGTNIYSVLLALGDEENGYILDKESYDRQLAICGENNLIPTIFPLNDNHFSCVVDGSHLIQSETREVVILEKGKVSQQMSYWEKLDFSVQIVRETLERQGCQILSYSSLPEMEINIWFEKEGIRSFVTVLYSDDDAIVFTPSNWLMNMMSQYDGYYAFFSMPRAKRGQGVYCSFKELKPLSTLINSK